MAVVREGSILEAVAMPTRVGLQHLRHLFTEGLKMSAFQEKQNMRGRQSVMSPGEKVICVFCGFILMFFGKLPPEN